MVKLQERLNQKILRERKKSGVPFVHPLFKTIEELNKKVDDLIAAGPVNIVPLNPDPNKLETHGYRWPAMDNLEQQVYKLRDNNKSIDDEPDPN